MKKILIALLLLIAAGAAVFALTRRSAGEPKFRTEKVTRGDITTVVTATGTVNAVTTVLVGTQVSGTIQKLYVDYNSRVKKGQIIAQIDPSTFQAQVEQQNANVAASKANLEKAQATLADAQRTMERNRELVNKGLIARSDFDTSVTNYDSARAQVSSSRALVDQAAAALKTAKTNFGYTKIISPVDGIVVSRSVDVGQTVAASFQTPTLFTIAQDLTKMQIDTSVAEADIGKSKVGQDVEFSVDAYPDTTFRGKVKQIRIAPVTVQNVVTYDVVVLVDNSDLRLMPGMTANVSIIIAEKKDVLKVPNSALRFRPERQKNAAAKPKGGAEKGPAVWILENKKPKRVAVTLGLSDGSATEVVAGLSEGQEVIVESLAKNKENPRQSGPRMF